MSGQTNVYLLGAGARRVQTMIAGRDFDDCFAVTKANAACRCAAQAWQRMVKRFSEKCESLFDEGCYQRTGAGEAIGAELCRDVFHLLAGSRLQRAGYPIDSERKPEQSTEQTDVHAQRFQSRGPACENRPATSFNARDADLDAFLAAAKRHAEAAACAALPLAGKLA